MIPLQPESAERGGAPLGVVLIVDDAPENLAMLHEALDNAGYRVLVATDGQGALDRVARLVPDVILLDAVMPGLDGFDTCRRLKADRLSAHVPVVFMTGLTETDHVLAGFRAGGVDYLTKPIKPPEVLARIDTHVRNARATTRARQAIDASGQAIVFVDTRGRVVWESDLARQWFGTQGAQAPMPDELVRRLGDPVGERGDDEGIPVTHAGRPLRVTRLSSDASGHMLLLRRRLAAPDPAELARQFQLTEREAEVLYWVVCGKANRDVASILGMSPRTVDKHLQHVFGKMNVESRTAAASLVAARSWTFR
ncbi:MAG: response regulator transcription factor [Burkholderiaceae bacterium]